MREKRTHSQAAFTLIELSIVLVIIGLIVGGVLVGRDLISAAAVRAQISQIEKYQTAVNTFRGKYGYLPGDIPDPAATQFGFQPRGTLPGQGDGNGQLQGHSNGGAAYGLLANGENNMFWVDLSTAHLIDGSFSLAHATDINVINSGADAVLAGYFPAAKLGQGSYVYVYSDGASIPSGWNPQNYYGISHLFIISSQNIGTESLTVRQAYDIDKKLDDGLPQSGNVIAFFTMNAWAGSGEGDDPDNGINGGPYTTPVPGDPTTCFDNSTSNSGTPGVNGNPQHYSLEINNGLNVNCALSFRFQ